MEKTSNIEVFKDGFTKFETAVDNMLVCNIGGLRLERGADFYLSINIPLERGFFSKVLLLRSFILCHF